MIWNYRYGLFAFLVLISACSSSYVKKPPPQFINFTQNTISEHFEFPKGAFTAVDFNGTLYVGTGDGLYSTSDGGKNWVRTGDINKENSLVVRSILVADDQLYIGTIYGVYKTADGGKSWVAINDGISYTSHGLPGTFIISSLISYDGSIYAGTLDEGVFKLIDGKRWQLINNGFENHQGDYRVTALAVLKNTLFAATTNGLYRTNDGGRLWVKLVRCPTLFETVNPSIISTGDTIFVSSFDGIIKFDSEYGNCWDLHLLGKGGSRILGTTIAATSGEIYIVTYDGVYRTTDKGKTWIESNKGLTDVKIGRLVPAGNTMFAVGENGKTYKFKKSESKWAEINQVAP